MINLYSDTQTKPSPEMRRAMAEAEVGDEQKFEDPTVNALCARVAELLGFEAAVFLPSGTMCNEIALPAAHPAGRRRGLPAPHLAPDRGRGGRPGGRVGRRAAPAGGPRGMFTADDAGERALRTPGDRYGPRSRLVSIEQTTNLTGGHVWPLRAAATRCSTWRATPGLRLPHGRRAADERGRGLGRSPAADWTAGFDTAWIDFSKGLGAPMGACLAGSLELIDEAWRYKQMLGGALRQAGIVAAGALYALDHNVERLAEDHAHARRLAEGLAAMDGISIDPAEITTNIVIFSVADPAGLCATLERDGRADGRAGRDPRARRDAPRRRCRGHRRGGRGRAGRAGGRLGGAEAAAAHRLGHARGAERRGRRRPRHGGGPSGRGRRARAPRRRARPGRRGSAARGPRSSGGEPVHAQAGAAGR